MDPRMNRILQNRDKMLMRELINTMSHSASSCVKASAVTWTQWNALQRSKTEKHMMRRIN